MVENFKKDLVDLYVLFVTARRSFQTLHWYVRGIDFDVYHSDITDGLIETITTDIDDIAEYMIRYNVTIPSPVNELGIAMKKGYPIYPSEPMNSETVSIKIQELTKLIYETTCDLRSSLDEQSFRDLVIYLESLIEKYSKEYKFFSKSRVYYTDYTL